MRCVQEACQCQGGDGVKSPVRSAESAGWASAPRRRGIPSEARVVKRIVGRQRGEYPTAQPATAGEKDEIAEHRLVLSACRHPDFGRLGPGHPAKALAADEIIGQQTLEGHKLVQVPGFGEADAELRRSVHVTFGGSRCA